MVTRNNFYQNNMADIITEFSEFLEDNLKNKKFERHLEDEDNEDNLYENLQSNLLKNTDYPQIDPEIVNDSHHTFEISNTSRHGLGITSQRTLGSIIDFKYQRVKFDYLFRFSFENEYPQINNHKEFNITKALLIDIKKVLEFDEETLREQQHYWLNFDHTFNATQQKRIKNTLETHCLTPIIWLDDNSIELTITPSKRIIRRKGCIIEQPI